MTSFADLRAANIARDKEWNTGSERLSLSFRGNELAGEVGEACNVIKKLERERIGLVGSRATIEDLADELADGAICIDLIAMDAGIDLGAAVARKFNATSAKRGLETRLAVQMSDPLRSAALMLVEALVACQSFEVEAGSSGEGPLVNLIETLGIPMPEALRDWLLDGAADGNEACDHCGEYHPAGVLDDGLCPSCGEAEERDAS